MHQQGEPQIESLYLSHDGNCNCVAADNGNAAVATLDAGGRQRVMKQVVRNKKKPIPTKYPF